MTRETYATREDWRKIRNRLVAEEHRLGGSMVGAAAGVNPFQSPYELWAELGAIWRGEKDATTDDLYWTSEAVRAGVDHEDYVARRFEERSGLKVHRVNAVLTSDDAPHLFASIDRKVENEESGLECKCATAWRDGAFTDGAFPDGYFRQVKTYLAVTGYTRWYLAVWVMGVAFRIYMVTRNGADIADLPDWVDGARLVTDMELLDCEDDAAMFVRLVEDGTPPAMTGADGEREAINGLHHNESAGERALDEDTETLIERRAELKRLGDASAEQLKAVENEIVARLEGAESAVGTRWRVTYKYADRRTLDKEAVKRALGGEIPEDCYKTTRGPTLRITPLRTR